MLPYDLHCHSLYSDGTDSPREIVSLAKELGVALLALTDHDTTAGDSEALEAGREFGVRVLTGVEMDCEWPREMHILGLNVDVFHPALVSALDNAKKKREMRNEEIIRRLQAHGYDISTYAYPKNAMITRLHIAQALAFFGYAESTSDAFGRFLSEGCVGYYKAPRITIEAAISVIHAAGGFAVWAHPYHSSPDPNLLAPKLKAFGLDALEAFHPSASEGQSNLLVSVARQNELLVTCGSDSHGGNRANVRLGQTWRDIPALEAAYEALMNAPSSCL